jgi:hypothetical protein
MALMILARMDSTLRSIVFDSSILVRPECPSLFDTARAGMFRASRRFLAASKIVHGAGVLYSNLVTGVKQ